jgi:hypothetical protein
VEENRDAIHGYNAQSKNMESLVTASGASDSQFTIHRNPNVHTKNWIPFLLDVQSDLVSDLETRVVIPLALATTFKGKILCRHGENF